MGFGFGTAQSLSTEDHKDPFPAPGRKSEQGNVNQDWRSQLATNGKATNWDKEVDVLVVGYGAAGGISAITAHDAGAKVY